MWVVYSGNPPGKPPPSPWSDASTIALHTSRTTFAEFVTSSSSCTTICVAAAKDGTFSTLSRLLTRTLKGLGNWGHDSFWLYDEIWREDLEQQQTILKDVEERRSVNLHAAVTSVTCNTLVFADVVLSVKEVGILSQALRSSPTLKQLFFSSVGAFGGGEKLPLNATVNAKRAAAFRELLDAVSCNNKLQTLSVTNSPSLTFEDPAHLSAFLRLTTSLTCLDLDFAVACNKLHKLPVTSSPSLTFEDPPIGSAFSAQTTSLTNLDLDFEDGFSNAATAFNCCANAIVDALVSHANTSITSLSLCTGDMLWFPKDLAISCIRSNLTLSDLSLEKFQIDSSSDFMAVMKSLESNHTLTRLSLANCRLQVEGPEEEAQCLAAILDALSKSGLPQLDLLGTRYHFQAPIQAMLARNALSHKLILKIKENYIPATAVRLFLCGDPYAGKTTLLTSLMSRTRIWRYPIAYRSLPCFGSASTQRTRGIEVRRLVKGKVVVSVWDMAGQEEFHAFHDHIFPDLSAQSSPTFFLFVWSPINHLTHQQKGRQAFEMSFSYWLKFINSKTRISNVLRRILVVLTRKDETDHVRDNIQPSVDRLMMIFQTTIELVGIYEVDARKPTSVQEVASCIFTTAQEVLENVQVCEICNDVIKHLSSKKEAKRYKSPLMTWDNFENKVCGEKFGIINDLPLCKAIASSLNENGELIYLHHGTFLILDPNWFCHDIVGDLIHFSSKDDHSRTMPIEEGFVTQDYLERLLESKMRNRGWVVSGEELVALMESLHLCCRVLQDERHPQLFIPIALSRASDSTRVLSWRGPSAMIGVSTPTLDFAGRRLGCLKKNHTFLTPGLFPLIQVSFHKAFRERGADVELRKDCIAIFHDDVEIIIEFCKVMGEHVIDVMVRSPQEADQIRTVHNMNDQVVNGIIRICADPAGDQGVELEEGIIRPDCLRDLATSHWRENQCVSVKDLEKELEEKLRSPVYSSRFLHTWNRNDKFGPGTSSIRELLGVEKYATVMGEFEATLRGDAEELGILKPASKSELRVIRRIESHLVREAEGRIIEGNIDSIPKDTAIMILDMRSQLYSQLALLNKKVDDLAANIVTLRNNILPEFRSMMVQLFQPLINKERLPRLCFLTREGLGVRRRLVTALVKDLKSIRLELFCEDRRRPHKIDEQEGISITALDEGLVKKGLPYFRRILRLLSLASKVGASVAGSPVPDCSSLICYVENSIASLDSQRIPKEEGRLKERFAVFHGWEQWLIGVLEQNGGLTASNIETKFKLRRAQYVDDSSQVAWLCDEHYKLETPFPFR